MAFESMRKDKPSRSKLCSFCKKNERDGKVEIVIKDKETKTVTSESHGACEKCAVDNYTAVKKVLSEAEAATK